MFYVGVVPCMKKTKLVADLLSFDSLLPKILALAFRINLSLGLSSALSCFRSLNFSGPLIRH